MVDFNLSTTQARWQDVVRRLGEDDFTFDRMRELEESPHGFDGRMWTALGEIGLLGLILPEPVGAGASRLDFAAAVEELAQHAILSPYLSHCLAARLAHGWNEPAARPIVSGAAAGKHVLTLALLEESDDFFCRQILARVVQTADGPVLRARKLFVEYGASADWLVVSALDERTGAPVWAVVESPRVRTERLQTIGGLPQYLVTAEDAPCELVRPDRARAELDETLMRLALFSAVELVGFAAQALAMTVAHVKDRVQFGQPLGKFQAVQHHAANMAMLTESARWVTYEVVQRADHGALDWPTVLTAKSLAGRAAVEVTALAHQLHAGVGYIIGHPLPFFSRRTKETELRWGTRFEMLGGLGDRIEDIITDTERFPHLTYPHATA